MLRDGGKGSRICVLTYSPEKHTLQEEEILKAHQEMAKEKRKQVVFFQKATF